MMEHNTTMRGQFGTTENGTTEGAMGNETRSETRGGANDSERKFGRILDRSAQNVTEEDIAGLPERLSEKLGGMKELEEGLGWVGEMIGRVKLFIQMLKDKSYQIETKTKLYIAGGLLYFILPVDLIPDFIPGIGYLDDAGVIALLWKTVADEFDRYVAFLSGRTDSDDDAHLSTVPTYDADTSSSMSSASAADVTSSTSSASTTF